MSATEWTERAEEPFRSDPSFARSVAASADALALTILSAVVALALGLMGAQAHVIAVPFIAPLVFLVLALWSARSFHSHITPAVRAHVEGQPYWRDRERHAVALTFGPALLRNRRHSA